MKSRKSFKNFFTVKKEDDTVEPVVQVKETKYVPIIKTTQSNVVLTNIECNNFTFKTR